MNHLEKAKTTMGWIEKAGDASPEVTSGVTSLAIAHALIAIAEEMKAEREERVDEAYRQELLERRRAEADDC